jgi:hypothetical protein
MNSQHMVSLLAVATALAASAGTARADPVAANGYSISLFASGPTGTSAADSVMVIGNDVYVGYGNGGAPDGTGGAMSTIVEFSRSGQLLNSTTITGHNDGLRYDAATNQIWALQNEDANANLVLITPGTLAKSAPISLTSVNPGPNNANGGGFDDVLFQGGNAFISASNPGKNPNTDPAIVSATLSGGSVTTTPALMGDATATLLNNNTTVTLNLQDPDSLSQTVDGRAVLTSQGDGELVFVSNLGKPSQTVDALQLSNAMVDDTAFGGTSTMSLLVADKTTNAVYKITGDFNPNWGYSAAQNSAGTLGFIGAFDAITAQTIGATGGVLTPIVTGLGNPGGEAFLAAPEPSTWGLILVGFAVVGLAGYRRSRTGAAIMETA